MKDFIHFLLHTSLGFGLLTSMVLAIVVEFVRKVLGAKWKWEPRDIWIGLYWDPVKSDANGIKVKGAKIVYGRTTRFFLCIIPCFPLIWDWHRCIEIKAEAHFSKEMKEGSEAAQAGRSRDVNPYSRFSLKWKDWDYGWSETKNAEEYKLSHG